MEEKPSSQSDEISAELMRCISRLSFVGMGLSDELDISLAELRRSIKNDAEIGAVKAQVENISKVLRTLEDKKSSLSVNEIRADIELLDQLLSRPLPSDFKKVLKKIEKEQTQIEAAQIIASIADSIESYLKGAIEGQSKQSKGLLGRLFSRDNKNGEASISEKRVIEDAVPEALKTTLFHLVEQLSAIENNQQLANQLSKKVSQLSKTEQLVEILEAVTGAFVDFAGHEHEQFENFLKSLGKRIDRVNEFIIQTVNFNQQFEQNSEQLDLDLKDSVNSLKDSLASSDSVSDIKNSLSQKMDAIVTRVNRFCELQQNSHKTLTENCENLQEQLRATEDESSRLKDELAAQRLRAQTDPLTRLPNRYSYNDRLTQEYNRWRRYRSPLSLVVGDIDYFKNVNDSFGHSAGDEVLKEIAYFLQSELRESDFVARYGGEEFVLLLPETSLVDSTKAVNKLRQGVKEMQVKTENEVITVTMSFGIAEFENNDTPKAVFNRADRALYRAKEKGRDQVCCQRAKPIKE